jgi:malonate transporter and related proteins
MALTVANALVPVFFVMCLGYFAGRRGIVDNGNVDTLNTLILNFALPAALFVATAQTPRQAILDDWRLFLLLAISMLAIFGFSLFLQLKVFGFTLGESSALTMSVALPNYVAVGLPMFAGIFGQQGMMNVAVAIVCGNVLMAPIGLVLLEAGRIKSLPGNALKRFLLGFWRSIRRPLVICPVAGIVFSMAGFALPHLWVRTFGLLGETTAGVALFLTGLILSSKPLSLDLNVILAVALKNLVHPLLTFVIASLMNCPTQMVREAVLLTAIPAGFFGVLFGVAYKVRSLEAGSLLLISSLSGALTLSITILLLPLIR